MNNSVNSINPNGYAVVWFGYKTVTSGEYGIMPVRLLIEECPCYVLKNSARGVMG